MNALLSAPPRSPSPGSRIAALAWPAIARQLGDHGFATLGRVLREDECRRLIDGYDDDRRFRSRVVMQRHAFGRGEYKYFAYPLPRLVKTLREQVYPRLAAVANTWSEQLGQSERYPAKLADFIECCHRSGQQRPTPLLLRYEADDYNCLHQDLYGELAFPLQMAILLSAPNRDFSGGEFILTEQRPRAQSKVEVVSLMQGEAVVFAVNQRPVQGARGYYRVKQRHGVSRIRQGRRYCLGIIFHDAA